MIVDVGGIGYHVSELNLILLIFARRFAVTESWKVIERTEALSWRLNEFLSSDVFLTCLLSPTRLYSISRPLFLSASPAVGELVCLGQLGPQDTSTVITLRASCANFLRDSLSDRGTGFTTK
ncbi:uncharacterized protein FOMMEDRAFT_21507 [Fomitiporia mediterranea MF3/22]|uniref:uncharacterized protein n=1 Tax=Fomitiporia mediterranea (strain MF3/22) TaxID=694068 RepID=UPI0004407301|nr:uncharacterized protein FOMMEDRAFT_21507 [Fomitiporia mediterranea MF3/22]EJD01053.1 hypothetical protein FOMMEDRAFT_21507 [Fomitiporia mediterranea MF3/22]